jgi:endoglucanase
MTELVIYLTRLLTARSLAIAVLVSGVTLSGCVTSPPVNAPPSGNAFPPSSPTTTTGIAAATAPADLLQQSWEAYRHRFIQADGRVIDREAGDRSTSEGQAYAMLRAVMIDDPETFALTLQWAEENMQRREFGDTLWVWKWGQNAAGNWGVLDANFASDGDMDAVTALILAARRWNRPEYLELARIKLADLWELSTVAVPSRSGTVRYFLPGPRAAFQPDAARIYINPSYLAPYAYRLFAQVDPSRDWLSLVDSSYQVFNQAAAVSAVGLPSDWVVFNTTTGEFVPMASASPLRTIYGFDAYRVWWRVSIDADWFDDPQAKQFLQQHLPPLQTMWRSQQMIPAQIDLQGRPLVDYESTAQYAMLYTAFRLIDPETAAQIQQQKLMPPYRDGFWDSDTAYYTQNLAWFALFPSAEVAATWLQP